MTVSISFLKDGRISINSAAPDVIPSDVAPSISPSIDLERIDAIRGYLEGGEVNIGIDSPQPKSFAEGGEFEANVERISQYRKSRLDSLREDPRVRWDENEKPYVDPELPTTTRTLVQKKIWAAQGKGPGITGALTKFILDVAARRPMQAVRSGKDLECTEELGRGLGALKRSIQNWMNPPSRSLVPASPGGISLRGETALQPSTGLSVIEARRLSPGAGEEFRERLDRLHPGIIEQILERERGLSKFWRGRERELSKS